MAVPPSWHLCPGTAKPSRWSRASTQASTRLSSSWLPATSLKPPPSCGRSVGAHPWVSDEDPLEPLGIRAPPQWLCQVMGSLLLCPGVKLSCLQGRKGSLGELHYYWDVGFCLGTGILANDLNKVIEASEKLYKLNAPGW